LQARNAEEPDVSEMLDLNDMYLFVKVIEHGGYSAASRALGIATSKLSRRIAELERQLGVHLVNRTTRSISLSDTGETFYRHCLAMVGEAQAAREAIERTRSAPQGTVRLSCPVGLLLSNVSAILARYMTDNPAVRIHLEATSGASTSSRRASISPCACVCHHSRIRSSPCARLPSHA